MTVIEVIAKLAEFNPHANVSVVVHNKHEEFSLCWGGSEGGTKQSTNSVCFYVDRLNMNEKEGRCTTR